MDGQDGSAHYIPVARIPGVAHRDEEELLFRGKNVKFTINDILYVHESSFKGHRIEIDVMKKLQKTLRNGEAQWNKEEEAVFKKLCNLTDTSFSNKGCVSMSTSQTSITVYSTYRMIADLCRSFAETLMCKFIEKNTIREAVVKNIRRIPSVLRPLLFGSDGSLSVLPIIKLLPNATALVLTDLDLEDITKNGEEYMKCLWEWVQLEQSEAMHVNLIELRSAMERGGNEHTFIKELIAKEKEEMRRYSCQLKYEYNDGGFHRITANRLDIPVPQIKSLEILWEPEISKVFGIFHFDDDDSQEAKSDISRGHTKAFEICLDAPPELLARFPGATMHFARRTVSSALKAIFENQSSHIRAEIKRIRRGSVCIEYDLIFGDADSMIEALTRITSSSAKYVHFNSMTIPVIFHREKVEMRFSEEVMTREVKKMRKAEEEQNRCIKLMQIAESLSPNRKHRNLSQKPPGGVNDIDSDSFQKEFVGDVKTEDIEVRTITVSRHEIDSIQYVEDIDTEYEVNDKAHNFITIFVSEIFNLHCTVHLMMNNERCHRSQCACDSVFGLF